MTNRKLRKDKCIVTTVELESDSLIDLTAAVEAALRNSSSFSGFIKDEGVSLTLLHYCRYDATPLPTKLSDRDAIVGVITDWLANEAVYGKQPDTDGDATHGFVANVDFHGVVVKPRWMIYGK